MENNKKTQITTVGNRVDPYISLGRPCSENDKFWRWGDDNLFPSALALMSRRSATHRRIINDKADYISGKGFTFNPEVPLLGEFVNSVNGSGESLRQVLNKLAFDKSLFGNAFLEVQLPETEAPTTTAPVTEESGCGSVVAIAPVMLIMLGAAAVVLKKKES